MMPGAAGAGAPGGGGYTQGMLLNSALKGGGVGGQPMSKAQAQRLQSMMGAGGPGWQQQQQQPMGSRTTNDMVGFGGMPAGYGMPPGQGLPRMPKQHYGQGGMVDPRAMNPAGIGPGGAQMMPAHMAAAAAAQGRTNQPRGMMMPGMNQGVPAGMASAFGQAGGQPGGMAGPGGTAGGGGYGGGAQSQGYQRTASQDLAYGYGGQPAASSAGQFGLSDGTDLDTTDGWMDEFFPGQ